MHFLIRGLVSCKWISWIFLRPSMSQRLFIQKTILMFRIGKTTLIFCKWKMTSIFGKLRLPWLFCKWKMTSFSNLMLLTRLLNDSPDMSFLYQFISNLFPDHFFYEKIKVLYTWSCSCAECCFDMLLACITPLLYKCKQSLCNHYMTEEDGEEEELQCVDHNPLNNGDVGKMWAFSSVQCKPLGFKHPALCKQS